jgi:hypothetical protein
MLESDFKKVVMQRLKEIPNSWFFSKEAVAVRGIPDIIGCVSGVFVALELKRSRAAANKTTGGIVLQKYNVEKIQDIHGFAEVVFPENLDWVLDALTEFCQGSDEFPEWH